ncbi:ParB/Srx family N-terminal domain-containing protein [Burkholderia ubonensis]|uniref:ParB/Srx family N-terminal domain-containing protein n=1 Tax=Burkholderia ubonensis TaxID=101571 RepID=UPI000A49CDA4
MQAQSVETVTPGLDTAEPAVALETNFGNEQPVVTVPYASLQRSPLNVRTKPPSGIAGLAANIRAKGLLQNLVVHAIKGARGKQHKYGVCAGQRREAALDLLFEQKHIAADYPVPVRIVSAGEALAISLIENSEREGLDPFDVLRAYRMLADEGRSVDYIAALFSASPLTVKRRMKLANVSPKLLALLWEDAITLDQLAALALADDHDTQEHLWFEANEWQRPAALSATGDHPRRDRREPQPPRAFCRPRRLRGSRGLRAPRSLFRRRACGLYCRCRPAAASGRAETRCGGRNATRRRLGLDGNARGA